MSSVEHCHALGRFCQPREGLSGVAGLTLSKAPPWSHSLHSWAVRSGESCWDRAVPVIPAPPHRLPDPVLPVESLAPHRSSPQCVYMCSEERDGGLVLCITTAALLRSSWLTFPCCLLVPQTSFQLWVVKSTPKGKEISVLFQIA